MKNAFCEQKTESLRAIVIVICGSFMGDKAYDSGKYEFNVKNCARLYEISSRANSPLFCRCKIG